MSSTAIAIAKRVQKLAAVQNFHALELMIEDDLIPKLERRDKHWRELHAEVDKLRAEQAVMTEEMSKWSQTIDGAGEEVDRLRAIIDELGGEW